jgi:arylformamidase
MSILSDLCAFGWVAALCVILSHPVHAANLDDFLNDGSVETTAPAKSSGGLGNFFGLKTVEGGRSNIGSPSIPAGIHVVHDFAYGSLPDQKMDIYTAGNPSGAPVIFMVHGGGWRNGGKDVSKTVNNKVARWVPEGFVMISINYPMIPDADVGTQADNVARALATAQKHAMQWGANPAKFILMGHSAGAHLVSLVNANPEAAYKLGAKPWIGTVSLDSGAMNVVELMQAHHARLYDQAFGTDPKQWKALSPYYAITAKAGPWLNVCSTKRDTSCSQSQAMADKAATLGVKAALHQENLTHGQINGNLGLPGDYTAAVESFMATLDPKVAQLLAHPVAFTAVPEQSSSRGGLLQRLRERRAAREQN